MFGQNGSIGGGSIGGPVSEKQAAREYVATGLTNASRVERDATPLESGMGNVKSALAELEQEIVELTGRLGPVLPQKDTVGQQVPGGQPYAGSSTLIMDLANVSARLNDMCRHVRAVKSSIEI